MDDIIVLDGKEYFIANRINYNNDNYLYVVGEFNSDKEFSVLKETEEFGNVFVESVNDENLVKEILSQIAKETI